MKKENYAFTLVELVVAATIIAILAATGFVAYTGYIDTGRDTNRAVQLSDLREGMQVYTVQNRLPIPTGSVNIQANTEVFAYQGNLSQSIIDLIGYNSGGRDPEYDTYPVYMLSSNKKDFQLMTFLSESDSQLSLLPEVQAVVPDYEILFPYSIGAPLGILLDTATQQPVHEFSDIITAGSYDIVTGTHALSAYISNDEQLNSSESLISMIPNQSCKRILEIGNATGSKVYTVNPLGEGNIRAYCDMETDGGGWMILVNNDNKDDESSDPTDCKPRLSGFSAHSCGSINPRFDFTINANGVSFNEFIFAGYEGAFSNILTFQYMKWNESQIIPSTETFETVQADSWDNELLEHIGKNTLRCSADPRYVSLQNGSGFFEPHFALGANNINNSELSFIDGGVQVNTFGLDDYQDGHGCSDDWTDKSHRGASAYIMVR